jgi:paraquat-inducible protein A
MSSLPLMACPTCDLLQRKIVPPTGGLARCGRCGAVLYRDRPNSLDWALACSLGALVLLCVANAFPIITLEVQGNRQAASLFDTVHELWNQDQQAVALLVGLTTLVFPALELAIMTYLLLPLRLGRVARGTVPGLHFLQTIRPWSMMEVFMLGILVSLVKLEHIAHVEKGIALWAFGCLIPLLAAAAAAFDPEDLWARVGDRQ